MSDQFSEQDLFDLFQKNLPNEPMSPSFAENLQRLVLDEVAATYHQVDTTLVSASDVDVAPQTSLARQSSPVRRVEEPSLLARLFDKIPSFQFGPSVAMMGAAAVVLFVLLNFNVLEMLVGVDSPNTGSSSGVSTEVAVNTPVPTDTATYTPIPTDTTTNTPVPASEESTELAVVATPTPATDELFDSQPEEEKVESAPLPVEDESIAESAESIESSEAVQVVEEQSLANAVQDDSASDASENAASQSYLAESAGTGSGPASDASNAGTADAETTDAETTDSETTDNVVGQIDEESSSDAVVAAQPDGIENQIVATATEVVIIVTAEPTADMVAQLPSATPTTIPPTIVEPTATSTLVVAPTATDVNGTSGEGAGISNAQASSTPSATNTPTPTYTATNTPTNTPTSTNTPIPTDTRTLTPVATNTPVPADTVTNTPIPVTDTVEPTKTDAETPEPEDTATNTPEPEDTATNTPEPEDTATDTPKPEDTVTDTPEPEDTATNTPVPEDTATNTPEPEDTATNIPVPPTETVTDTPVPPTATQTKEPVNRPPQLVELSVPVSVNEDEPTQIDIRGNIVEPDGDTIAVTIVDQPTYGTIIAGSESGLFTYTPNANYDGPDADIFNYEVSDGLDTELGFISVTFIGINDAPIVNDMNIIVLDEDAAEQMIPVLGSVVDVEGDPITLLDNVSGAQLGTVRVDGGMIVYTPNPNQHGNDTLTFTVSDGQTESTGTVNINIVSVDDAPITRVDLAELPEDTSTSIVLLDNDEDVDGDVLEVVNVAGSVNASVVLDGQVAIYTPNQDFYGTDIFTYTVSDGTTTSVGTAEVTVTGVDDPPTAADIDLPMSEDTIFNVNLLSDYVADIDSPELTITEIFDVVNGLATSENGVVAYEPTKDFNGVGGFKYIVSDGNSKSTGTFALTITPVNDAPVLVSNEPVPLIENSKLSLPVLAAAMVTDVDGDTLTASITVPPQHAEFYSLEDGTLVYQPEAGFAGEDTVTYEVTDGELSITVEKIIVITAVNDPPKATEDVVVATGEDDPATFDLLDYVSDPDTDRESLSIISLVEETPNGRVEMKDGTTAIYTPSANYSGEDSITYTVSDGEYEVTVTLSVVVSPVNDEPLLVVTPPITGSITSTMTYRLEIDDPDVDDSHVTELLGCPDGTILEPGESDTWELRIPVPESDTSCTVRATDSTDLWDEVTIAISGTPLEPTPEPTVEPTPEPTATSIPTPTTSTTSTVGISTTVSITVPVVPDASAASVAVTTTAPITTNLDITVTVPISGTDD